MAYDPKNLSVLTYANGFTLWHYVTDDKGTLVEEDGYFDKASDMLRRGDMIMINAGFSDEEHHHAAIFLVAQSKEDFIEIVMVASS